MSQALSYINISKHIVYTLYVTRMARKSCTQELGESQMPFNIQLKAGHSCRVLTSLTLYNTFLAIADLLCHFMHKPTYTRTQRNSIIIYDQRNLKYRKIVIMFNL